MAENNAQERRFACFVKTRTADSPCEQEAGPQDQQQRSRAQPVRQPDHHEIHIHDPLQRRHGQPENNDPRRQRASQRSCTAYQNQRQAAQQSRCK